MKLIKGVSRKACLLFFLITFLSLFLSQPVAVFAGTVPKHGNCQTNDDCLPDLKCKPAKESREGVEKNECLPAVCGSKDDCPSGRDCLELNGKRGCYDPNEINKQALTDLYNSLSGGQAYEPTKDLVNGFGNFIATAVLLLGARVGLFYLANVVDLLQGAEVSVFGFELPVGTIIASFFAGLDDLMDAYLNVWFITFTIGSILSLFLWLSCVLAGWAFHLNLHLIESSVIHAGMGITSGVANLGFIIALLVIGFSTMFRFKDYEMKKTLSRLIIAILLINFSLLIIGLFINISNALTEVLLGGPYSSVDQPVFVEVWNRFNVFSAYNAVMAGFWNGWSISNIFARVFILPPFGLLGASLITLIAFVTVAFLACSLFFRYIALTIIIIFSPIVWIGFIFPKLEIGGEGNLWKLWWTEFLRWLLFLPIVAFFFFLVGIMFDYPGDLYKQGVFAYIGQLVVIILLLLGGLLVAKKMSIPGAKQAFAVAERTGKFLAGRTWALTRLRTEQSTARSLAGFSPTGQPPPPPGGRKLWPKSPISITLPPNMGARLRANLRGFWPALWSSPSQIPPAGGSPAGNVGGQPAQPPVTGGIVGGSSLAEAITPPEPIGEGDFLTTPDGRRLIDSTGAPLRRRPPARSPASTPPAETGHQAALQAVGRKHFEKATRDLGRLGGDHTTPLDKYLGGPRIGLAGGVLGGLFEEAWGTLTKKPPEEQKGKELRELKKKIEELKAEKEAAEEAAKAASSGNP